MEKAAHGGDRKSSSNNYHLKTHERLATHYNVSPSTIQNNEKYYNAIETLGNISPDAKNIILNGGSGVKKKDIIAMDGKSDDELQKFATAILEGPGIDTKDKFKSHKGGWYIDDRNGRGFMEILPSTREGFWYYSCFTPDGLEHIYDRRPMTWYGIEISMGIYKFSVDELIPFDMKPISHVLSQVYSKNMEYMNKEWESSIKRLAKTFFVSPEVVSGNYNYYVSLNSIYSISPEVASEIAEIANEQSPWGMYEVLEMMSHLEIEELANLLVELIDDGVRDSGYLKNKYKLQH
jgi:hypothetical protein